MPLKRPTWTRYCGDGICGVSDVAATSEANGLLASLHRLNQHFVNCFVELKVTVELKTRLAH